MRLSRSIKDLLLQPLLRFGDHLHARILQKLVLNGSLLIHSVALASDLRRGPDLARVRHDRNSLEPNVPSPRLFVG
jgi:hypothetical protein